MNQASYEAYIPELALPMPPVDALLTPEHHHHHPGQPCESASSSSQKPKNVPEELKMFLMSHADQWYTNEQLAEHLNHTASGIRNAVTKLKNTGLIKTRMTGPLAYRGWHTASLSAPLPLPEVQKRLALRKCNRCDTTYSRYWRSDLEEPNKWLCNNCGMNQRRGRLSAQKQMQKQQSALLGLPQLPKGPSQIAVDRSSTLDIYNSPIAARDEVADDPSYTPGGKADDNQRQCAKCYTYKSAGKWRRDRDNYANYLCNKCGMNQRRASLKKQKEDAASQGMNSGQGSYSSLSISSDSRGPQTNARSRKTSAPRQSRSQYPCCSLCNQAFPSLEVDPCKHRFCGECVPVLVHQAIGRQTLECPVCQSDSPDALPVFIATAILGGFLLDNFDQN